MNKAREYPNCRVIICGEEYTSQTCSECGYLNRKIGGAKEFKCPGCNQESDRDFNAARNILLKNMSLIFRDWTLSLYSWVPLKRNFAKL
jgi:putative transposase